MWDRVLSLDAADAATAALHIGYVADELGAPFPKPNIIHIDATAAKSFFENTGGASKPLQHIAQHAQKYMPYLSVVGRPG